MIAVSEVVQETGAWIAIAVSASVLIGAVWKLFSKLSRLIDTTDRSAAELTELKTKVDGVDGRLAEHQAYARFHWGPNGKSMPAHMRLRRLEKAMNLDDID